MEWAIIARQIYIRSGLILVGVSLVAGLFYPPGFVTGILLGGLIALGNLYVMQDNVVRVFSSKKAGRKKLPIVGKFYLRLTLLGLLIYLSLKAGIEPVALLLGFSTLVLGIITLAFNRPNIKAKEAC